MCDPITLTAVSSGMSYLGGTSMLAGTTLGTGLINAASYINATSTIGKASSAIFGGGTFGTLSTYASLGLSAAQGRSQAMADRGAAQNARIEAEQHRANAERERIKYRQEELERRKKYMSDMSSSRALMARYGYTMQSPSANALLRKNRETYMQDANAIYMTGLDQVLESKTAARVRTSQAQQLEKSARRRVPMALASNVQDQLKTFKEAAITSKLNKKDSP
tara:strand:- start:221 stop:886 length:666 start_codon:yes stop_codon:yes gene_type:complete